MIIEIIEILERMSYLNSMIVFICNNKLVLLIDSNPSRPIKLTWLWARDTETVVESAIRVKNLNAIIASIRDDKMSLKS